MEILDSLFRVVNPELFQAPGLTNGPGEAPRVDKKPKNSVKAKSETSQKPLGSITIFEHFFLTGMVHFFCLFLFFFWLPEVTLFSFLSHVLRRFQSCQCSGNPVDRGNAWMSLLTPNELNEARVKPAGYSRIYRRMRHEMTH